MPTMTGGQALVRSLSREGIRVIFGLPGAQQYHALDALYDQPEIRYIATRHEQAASYMADGYARVTGDVGTAMVVPGPGLFNASAGIATAYAASSPVLVITGENHRGRAGQGGRRLDATSDEMDWIRPMTKWAARALKPADVPSIVHEAFFRLRTGRPSPVEIEIPPVVLAAEADVELMEPVGVERPRGSPERIQQGASILAGAKRPAIWAGGGVIISEATPALQRLAEHLQAPVVTTPNGKGALSDRHPMSLGLAELRYAPLRQWLVARDVILVVGTRSDVAWQFKEQQIVQINIDAEEIGDAPNAVGIVGDARRSLEDLAHLITAMTPARPDCADEVRALNAARFDPAIQLEPQHSLMHAIRAAMPDDGILVPCMNQMGYYSRNYYPVYVPRTYLTASYYGTLGFAFPVALGAKVARPDRAVVAVSADGGFLYNAQELATAVQYGINVVVIVFNDNAYGNVLRAQVREFRGRVIGTQLHNPDFVKLAEAYGARGVRTEGADELESALREALAVDAPTLIEAPVGMMERQY